MSNTAPFLHIAYANNDTGTLDFTTTGGIERDYTGFYTDEYATDSSDPTKYKWLTNAEFKNKVNTHVAYSESSDGVTGFTTAYPNLNLLDGTKDFSGASWVNLALWQNDGTYKGLTVKSTQGNPQGLFQRFTVPEDGDYTFSIYVSATNGLKPILGIGRNGSILNYLPISISPSNMTRISYLANGLKKGDVMTARIEELSQVGSKISVAGHKWEKSTIATSYMESASEIKNSNYPSFIGVYYDYSTTASTDPTKYKWLSNADFKNKVSTAAYAKSADGKDDFTTVYPNLNLLNGTKDFSGDWTNSSSSVNDGTYKGLAVKKRTAQWNGIYKTFTAPKGGTFTFSAYIKVAGTGIKVQRIMYINGERQRELDKIWDSAFDWTRNSLTLNLNANDVVIVRYEISVVGTDSILWTAGHKWEQGSTATPYMQSVTEVKDSDYPQYIGLPNVINPTTFKDYEWTLLESIPKKILNTHVAYANSSDWITGFTTTYPNLNLLDGTKDFSGTWNYSGGWINDGTLNTLTVKKRTASQYLGIYKAFTVPKDGTYTFSAYVKSSGNNANIVRYGGVNSVQNNATMSKTIGNNFDWTRDSVTLNLKANDVVWFRYEITGNGTDSILWNAGHKWEEGSVATPWMPSASEVKNSDYPKFVGTYYDDSTTASQSPTAYNWSSISVPGPTPPTVADNLYVLTMPTVKSINLTYGIGTLTTKPMSWLSAKPKLDANQVLWYKSEITGTDNSVGVYYSNLVGGSNLDDGDSPLDNTVVSIVLNNKTVNVPRDLALKLELLSQTLGKRDDDLAQLIADTNDRITNIDMGSGQAGLNQEVLDRRNADDSLGLRIDTVTGNVSDLTTTTQTKFTNIEKQLGGFSVQGTKSSSLTRPSIVFNYNAYGATLPDGSSDGGGRLYYQVPGDTTYDVKELKFNYQTIPSFYDMDQITIWEDSWSKLYGGFPWRDTIVTTSDIDTFYIDGMTTYYDHNGDLVIRGKVVMDGMDDWIGSMNNRGFKPDTVVITVASDLKSVKSIRFTGDMGVIVMNISLGYGAISSVQRLGRKISFIGASPKNTLTTTGSWVNLNEKIPYGMRPINSIEISTGLLNSNNTVNYLFGSDSVIRIYQSSNNANQFQVMGQVGWETLNQYPPVNYSSNTGWNSR